MLVALSRTVAEDFQRFHQVRPERIRVVYNGVDTNRFSPNQRTRYREPVRRQWGIGDKTALVLTVAHNFRLKGVGTLLRAMSQLVADRLPVHLAVVGGKRLSFWRRMAKRLGIGNSVSFVGPVEDTVPYYAAADIFAHPTFYDPCSLVLLEAAASGLPIITTRPFNGVSELMQEGVEGLILSDPTNATGLANHLRVLLNIPVRRKMGRAARQMALMHSFDHNVEQMLAIYREVARCRRQAA